MACVPRNNRTNRNGVPKRPRRWRQLKLILFPLLFLIAFTFLSQLGITDAIWSGTSSLSGNPEFDGWYDANGHLVAYANTTKAGEAGTINYVFSGIWQAQYDTNSTWTNATNTYPIYDSPLGANAAGVGMEFSMTSSLGLIAIIIVIMILATFAGLRILGSGTSGVSVSVIVLGTALLTIWGVFSVLAMPLITNAGLLAPSFYFFLTALYVLGMINKFSNSGDE